MIVLDDILLTKKAAKVRLQSLVKFVYKGMDFYSGVQEAFTVFVLSLGLCMFRDSVNELIYCPTF